MQLDNLCAGLEKCKTEYVKSEPMSRHTTFKIGGNADVFISIKTEDELKTVLELTNEYGIPCFILGKGSNLLVSDSGIEGAVLCLDGLDEIKITDETVVCGAGASLKNVCLAARDAGLSVFEFSNEQLQLGYRTSIFKNSSLIVTSVTFKLKHGDKQKIKADMDDFLSRRQNKQPLEYPSAGSTFKRPQGYFAGALIEKNNLKGVSVGGAQVSQKHAGFIINTGSATCLDVLSLIKKVQNTVKNADGVDLEPEVIFVGRK